MTTVTDIFRLLRAASEETDAIDRARLIRRAREEATRLSDEDFETVEDALHDAD